MGSLRRAVSLDENKNLMIAEIVENRDQKREHPLIAQIISCNSEDCIYRKKCILKPDAKYIKTLFNSNYIKAAANFKYKTPSDKKEFLLQSLNTEYNYYNTMLWLCLAAIYGNKDAQYIFDDPRSEYLLEREQNSIYGFLLYIFRN